MAVTMARTQTIEQLNERAGDLANGATGHDAYLAALDAARELGFRIADDDPNQGDCVALVNGSIYVNLWNHPEARFDDQISWYDELQADYATATE